MEGFLLWLLAVCIAQTWDAPQEQITLLPSPDGQPTAVVVQSKNATQVVSQAYANVLLTPKGELQTGALSEAQVKARYPQLFAFKPKAEVKFVLQFKKGTAELDDASLAQLPALLADVSTRAGGEAVVIGYADRVGTPQSNEVLSLQRAKAVRQMLIDQGIAPDKIEAIGRGEREPVVPTGPGVDEPRNRRVEVLVR